MFEGDYVNICAKNLRSGWWGTNDPAKHEWNFFSPIKGYPRVHSQKYIDSDYRKTLYITSEGSREMFEGDFAYMSSLKFLLMSMGSEDPDWKFSSS